MNKMILRVLWPLRERNPAAYPCELQDADGALHKAMRLDDALVAVAAAQQAAASMSPLLILLPAELSLLDNVRLPARNQRQALQALPFVVEEQLGQDLEDVHLAVGARKPEGHWPVLVIDRVVMDYLQAQLEQTGIVCYGVFVDAELLSADGNALVVLMAGERVLLRTATQALAMDIADSSLFIQKLLHGASVTSVIIWREEENAAQTLLSQQWQSEFAVDEIAVSENFLTKDFSSFLLQHKSASAINLLQGRYQQKEQRADIVWWQLAAAVLVFAWLGQLGLQVSSGWFFDRAAGKLDVLAQEQYRKLFPEARKTSDPRKRIESRLAGGGADMGNTSFAVMFGNSIQAMSTLPDRNGLSIEQLRYEGKNGELQLDVKARSIEQLDQFKQALDKTGFTARISSANDSETGITGRLQITSGA